MLAKPNTAHKLNSAYYLALLATCLAFCVIILGVYTRLTDAGLGCPDWPGCYGHWVLSKLPNASAHPIDMSKAWTEMIHRYVAAVLGLLVLALTFLAFRNRHQPNQPFALSIFLGLLVIFQALLGMWTVTLKLFPLVVMAHLIGGMTTLALLGWLSLQLSPYVRCVIGTTPSSHSLRYWAKIGLWILALQLILGGWTSANYAALACTDFPFCHIHLNLDFSFLQALKLTVTDITQSQADLKNSNARMTIHMLHRLGALITTLVISRVIFLAYSKVQPDLIRVLSLLIAILLLVQLLLGISNILGLLPLAIAIAHSAVAALLLLSFVSLNYYLNFKSQSEAEC